MRLVACPTCHAQYDAGPVPGGSFTCRCGTRVSTTSSNAALDAAVARCSSCGALLDESDRNCPYCRAAVTRHFPPTGPVCPQCYARNPDGARHCVACGVEFEPQPVRSTDVAECPVCPGVRLGARHVSGYWVDECPSCLGLWAPGDVLDRLVDRVRRRYQGGGAPSDADERPRRAAWQTQVTYRKCPVCAGLMQRKNFAGHSGVVVDWCGDHGVWLDSGETEDIAAFVLKGGLRDVRPESTAQVMGRDPGRAKAALAAEQILAEERGRLAAARPTRGVDWSDAVRGVGDLLARLLK